MPGSDNRSLLIEENDFPTASPEDIDRVREHLAIRTILVGHTIVPSITPLCDGKVIAVQVYPRPDEKTSAAIMEALRIERGKFFRARIDGSLEPLQ